MFRNWELCWQVAMLRSRPFLGVRSGSCARCVGWLMALSVSKVLPFGFIISISNLRTMFFKFLLIVQFLGLLGTMTIVTWATFRCWGRQTHVRPSMSTIQLSRGNPLCWILIFAIKYAMCLRGCYCSLTSYRSLEKLGHGLHHGRHACLSSWLTLTL